MTFILVDDEYYKITLQIVEDFIGENYDDFIENGPTDDIKLIKWELVIYFKKLEDKKKSIIEYYMDPIYKSMKKDIRTNFENFKYTVYINRYSREPSIFCKIDTITIDFKKNISTKTITIKFICNETYKHNSKSKGNGEDPDKFYNYLNQLRYIIYRILSENYKIYYEYDLRNYNTTKKISMNNDIIKLHSDKVIWFKDIVKKHYNNILINFGSYIEYCKTNGINIDFRKITERIRYIKEYVRENYNITLV